MGLVVGVVVLVAVGVVAAVAGTIVAVVASSSKPEPPKMLCFPYLFGPCYYCYYFWSRSPDGTVRLLLVGGW